VSSALEGLEPAPVWRYFGEISRIPRGSKNEAAVGKYVRDVARGLGLAARVDRVGNVVVSKPASPGRERAPRVCLQGHLDMVCEKNKDTIHDFAKDPIRLVRDGAFLRADGTTLGADNGIAVAVNLAVMEDRTLEHGPLELLFTVDEETGLTGANGLAGGFLESRILLNLDSEEEGALYVGCAGGRSTRAVWKVATAAAPPGTAPGELQVRGLEGGHSGLEIDKERGNAIKVLARALAALEPLGVRVARIDGGNKHNAIPREAEAALFVPRRAWGKGARALAALEETVRAELGPEDAGLRIALVERAPRKAERVLAKPWQTRVVQALRALPHGVIRRSRDIPGLVETSTNVATLRTRGSTIELVCSQRSSVASGIVEICATVQAICELGGAKVRHSDGYPAWKPDMDSGILRVAKETYRALYGRDPEVKAIHAGLECGVIGEKHPGMDMVSFGPTMEGVHTPNERIHVNTVPRFWEFLLGILRSVR
jgi:dipeptidase D